MSCIKLRIQSSNLLISVFFNLLSLVQNSHSLYCTTSPVLLFGQLQEGDPVIAQGARGVVSSAHSEMPGKLSAEPGAAA